MGGGGKKYQEKPYHDHSLTEKEVLGFLKSMPDGATSVQIEDNLHGTHGHQVLLDLLAQGKVHQVGAGQTTYTRKYPWALGPP